MITGLNQPNLPMGSIGFVNLIALTAIAAMSILAAPLGAAAAHGLDPVKLKRVFGVHLLITSAFMLLGPMPVDALLSRIAASRPAPNS